MTNRLALVLALSSALGLASCRRADPPSACEPIPATGGIRTVLAEGGKVTLRVPETAHLSLTDDCKRARWIGLNYAWRAGALAAEESQNLTHVQPFIRVRVIVASFGPPANTQPDESWRYGFPLLHSAYPLEMYPHAYWPSSRTKAGECTSRCAVGRQKHP